MAAATATAEDAPAPKKGPSMIMQIVLLLVLTLAAAGGGFFSGGMLRGEMPPPPAADADASAGADAGGGHGAPAAGGHGASAGGGHGEQAGGHGEAGGGHGDAAAEGGHGDAAAEGGHGAAPAATTTLFNLAPITTNLAAPSDIWARMEVTVQFDVPPVDPTIVDMIHQDLLSFMRTVKMHQIEGASGIQHLKADLEDRASVRTGGHVKHVFIRTLLFE
ncbi:MAG: flagellar basal body-associated FliL family protein [Rhizobiaceae bacterium]